ncbi:hypothetical protein [Deinococcus ruber]|uniref:ZU5 domain-containing protein n=1 Tax=Deinococcus ruber TaxID=1848197 RepID=A0A918F8L3_9DEIO|nr:hypothetical protein [Deinococcus ruber]GGR19389.1 hypothetical protein GCM10008957_34870 [Deinococcus ruber]
MKKTALLGLCLALSVSACTTSAPPTGNTGGGGPSGSTPSPIGTPVTAIIGAAGGTLSVPGGPRIDIPPGALVGDQTVGIQPINGTAPGTSHPAYRLTPEGTSFAKPVRVTFAYTDQDTEGSAPEALSIAYQDRGGVWQMYRHPTRDLVAHTVSVETNHFSDWSMVEGVQLLPLKATVQVGQSVPLEVVDCAPLQDGDDLFVPLPNTPTNECAANVVASHVARNWSVDGVAGGTSAAGTVTSTEPGTATYTAPARQPAKNPVAVSVQINDLSGARLTLVSNVTVTDDPPTPLPVGTWSGTVRYHEEGQKTTPATPPSTGQEQATVTYDETQTIQGTVQEGPESSVLTLKAEAQAAETGNGYNKTVSDWCSVYVTEDWWDFQATMSGQNTVQRTLEQSEDGAYQLAFQSIGTRGTMTHHNRQKVTAQCPPPDPSGDRSWSSSNDFDLRGETVAVKLVPDPKNANHYTGHLQQPGEQAGIKTTLTVDWDLTRVP